MPSVGIPLRSVKIPYSDWTDFAAIARRLGMKTGPMIAAAVLHYVRCPYRETT